MKKNKWRLFVTIVLVSVVVVIFVVKSHKVNSEDEEIADLYEDSCEYDFWESGNELFCHFMSSDKWPQDSFFVKMTDLYNSYILLNGINSIIDEWRRYEDSDSALMSLQKIDVNVIRDRGIKDMFSKCVNLGLNYFANETGGEEFQDWIYFIDSTLTARFNIYNFMDFSEEKYWEEVNFVGKVENTLFKGTHVEKVTHENYNSKKVQRDIELILKRINDEKDFNRKCMYTMAYVYHVGFWRTDFSVIEPLLDDGRYSHHLFFLWRIWRCGEQLGNPCYGPSTWSVISNVVYNEKRLKIAEATLKHLVDHRDDAIALNQYLMTATLPNILRDGEYPIGNESFTEVWRLGLAESDNKSE